MSQNQLDRRKFLSVGAAGVAVAAVGMRAVIAQDENGEGTPVATPGTPGATPGASPAASPAAGATEITVVAIDIDYERAELSMPADTDVEVTLVNEGALPHDWNVEDTEFGTEVIPGGEETTITVNLPAGDYIYFCSVPGHREAGMEGTLTVE